jgi:cyanuric acid amidohydrolase
MKKVSVFKIPQSSPDDLSGLIDLVEVQQLFAAQDVVAIMGKTEGNGCVNDFTRGFAVATLKAYLKSHGAADADKVVYVMSGGTEGVLSPHMTIFVQCEISLSASSEGEQHEHVQAKPPTPRWGLTLGVHHTRDFLVEEIGTLAMVAVVAAGVEAAMDAAGLTAEHVHLVQIKCPLIVTALRKTAAGTGTKTTAAQQDSYKSMAHSRAASALGVALALGEISPLDLTSDNVICNNYDLFSSVASTSAGVELQNCEILVLGNAPDSYSDCYIAHNVMAHALDSAAVYRARESAATVYGYVDDDGYKVVNVFCKAEADPTGQVLGCRHTMLDDSDINHTRMARAVVGAVVASVVQDPMIYVSGGAEHQGPPGGGPIAVIYRAAQKPY